MKSLLTFSVIIATTVRHTVWEDSEVGLALFLIVWIRAVAIDAVLT